MAVPFLLAISGSSWGQPWLLLHLAAVGVRVDVVNCFIDTPPSFFARTASRIACDYILLCYAPSHGAQIPATTHSPQFS